METLNDVEELLQQILQRAPVTGDSSDDMFSTLIREALASCPAELDPARHRADVLVSGGLAAWRLRKAQRLMMESTEKPVSIAAIADECRLSHSQFNRAFKLSVGTSPRQWFCDRRIEKAQWLLLNSAMSLPAVAKACGLGGQCHFTRKFTRSVGMAPGGWRRAFSASSQSWQSEARQCDEI